MTCDTVVDEILDEIEVYIMSFDVIVVTYNRRIADIAGLSSCMQSPEVSSVIVCDNSEDAVVVADNASAAFEYDDKLRYLPMCGNQGLAKAYNRALEECKAQFVVVFDDDTPIPDDYFAEVRKHCEDGAADIYLPIVRSKYIILSPCIKSGMGFKAADSVAELESASCISAINSGMVVRRSLYERCRYDERLFVDGIDHRFMDEARSRHARIEIMSDVNLTQQYSQEEFNERKQMARLRIKARDYRTYYSDTIARRMYCALMILHWKIQMARKYHRLSLLWMNV